jgi:GntR family transcriptional regulator
VKRAYLELEREGIIVTQHGKGSIVAPDPGLAPRLYGRELEEHLERAARIGNLLGLGPDDLADRLRDTSARLSTDILAKETA